MLELYNLERDPGERHNLATRRPEMVIRLRDLALNYYRSAHTRSQAMTDVCFSENWFRHDSWDCRPQNMYGQFSLFSLLVAKRQFEKSIFNLSQVLDSSSAFGGLSGWCRAVVDTKCRPGGGEHRETMR